MQLDDCSLQADFSIRPPPLWAADELRPDAPPPDLNFVATGPDASRGVAEGTRMVGGIGESADCVYTCEDGKFMRRADLPLA